jgi:hypothetical protein
VPRSGETIHIPLARGASYGEEEGQEESSSKAEAMRPKRNDPCPCGSGRKYKHCCLAKDEIAEGQALEMASRQDQKDLLANTKGLFTEQGIFTHGIPQDPKK